MAPPAAAATRLPEPTRTTPWVNADKRHRGQGNGVLDEEERAELARLRRENADAQGVNLG
jgi:hypothetical protein